LTTATTTTNAAIQKTDTKTIWMPPTTGLLPRAAAVDGAQETHLRARRSAGDRFRVAEFGEHQPGARRSEGARKGWALTDLY
jgi:hypothetical protein